MAYKFYNAIIVTIDGKGLKYKKIGNLKRFEKFAQSKSGDYIMYYFNENKSFSHRHNLINKSVNTNAM